MLFGGVRCDPDADTGCHYPPYLEITDPLTGHACSTTLELDKSVLQHTSEYTTVHIRVCSGANYEKGSPAEKEDMSFVSDASRGIIVAEVYWHTPGSQQVQYFQSSVFVLDVEGLFSKVPSSSDLEKRHVQWNELSLSAAIFSYHVGPYPRHRILLRYSYTAGFRYVSPTQPLDSNDLTGPRCFFVYDFNPHRETSGPLTLEDPDLETGYQRSANEITREVVGGLSCWKMRFDLPAAGEGLDECHVALMDDAVVFFEVRCFSNFSLERFDG